MGQIRVTKSRFPRVENYFLLTLLLWLFTSLTAAHFSRLQSEHVFKYTFARVIVATGMEKHFAVPIRKTESAIRQGEFPWLALPAAPLVAELIENAARGGEWQKLDLLVKAIIFTFPMLATLIAATVFVFRRRSRDPATASKDVVRGVVVKTYKRSLMARIFGK